ncbi:MAG: hypothetical protein KBC62_01640 [Candidatus Pacebacteria bacterium]|nr:hypothetical protein [Candidatus Paceibacterota bacterium]MBP9842683.1 hypothetical protein [Candidatus Paceibacterota bacterium]
MTITIELHCACGKKERVEIGDDEVLPEQCRACGGFEMMHTPNEQSADTTDLWNLTVVPPQRRQRKPMY